MPAIRTFPATWKAIAWTSKRFGSCLYNTEKQRREMGLTFRNIRRVMAEMQAAGELQDKDRATIAVEVMGRLVDENPKAFQDAGGIEDWDWDAILEFIEKLIPLIMQIIAMFSDATAMPLDVLVASACGPGVFLAA